MAYSGFQTTRLGVSGFARRLYGSFSGKTEATITGLIEFVAPNYVPHFTAEDYVPHFTAPTHVPHFTAPDQ